MLPALTSDLVDTLGSEVPPTKNTSPRRQLSRMHVGTASGGPAHHADASRAEGTEAHSLLGSA